MPRSLRQQYDEIEAAKQQVKAYRAVLESRLARVQIASTSIGFQRSVWAGDNPLKPFHEQWLNLADEGNSFVLLAARDHFKTSVLTLNHSLYRIVRNPNVQGLLVSESSQQARKWSRWLRRNIEQHYPWLVAEENWTERQFTVRRTRDSKDPTIEAVGMLGRILGGHYDFAIVDDVVSLENTRSEVLREHVEEWFTQVLIPAMVPESQIIVVGSPWHYADLYAKLEREGWKVIKYPALINGVPIFPERYSLETLAKKRDEVGTPVFNCQYLCDPSGLVGKLLKETWLEPFYEPPLPPDLETVQGVDLAWTEEEANDYTAIATVGYSPSTHTMYLLNIERRHIALPEQMEWLVDQYPTWKPWRMIVESNALQGLLIVRPLLKQTMLPIIPRETVKKKHVRINAMGPYFETKRLMVRRDQHDFISEYVQFPDGEHDDMLDALELVVGDIVARHMTGYTGPRTTGLVLGKPKYPWSPRMPRAAKPP